MIPLEYVKTDRNGTKYFNDWTCPRCGGAGEAQKWEYTGKICWGCGGTGRRPKPLVVKEYTLEYAAKLEERRKAREAKRFAENPPPSQDELQRMADEARRNVWESEGFNRDGTGYLHTGETYKNRSKLQARRGRWNSFLRGYVIPERVEGLRDVRITEIRAQDFCNINGYIDIDKALAFIEGHKN